MLPAELAVALTVCSLVADADAGKPVAGNEAAALDGNLLAGHDHGRLDGQRRARQRSARRWPTACCRHASLPVTLTVWVPRLALAGTMTLNSAAPSLSVL